MAMPTRRPAAGPSKLNRTDSNTDTGHPPVDSYVVDEVDESGTRIGTVVLDKAGKLVDEADARPTTTEHTSPNILRSSSTNDIGLLLWRQVSTVFLPAGYPHSVTEDYLEYQIYDSLQAFASSIAGLLSSRAVLVGVGVGDAAANPTTALLLSVLQDSVGRLATILFAHRLGTSLEPECKAYRLAADVFNDAAMILDCLSPVFPKPVRVAVLSASSVLRALCGVAAGSAKASLSAHFAKRGNLGEVNAKDSSQETIISLAGMLAGTLVVSHVTSTLSTWIWLLCLLTLHLYLNYRAVRAVNMTTLNRQRASNVFSVLLARPEPNAQHRAAATTHLTPRAIAQNESVFAMDGALRRSPPDPILYGQARFSVPFAQLCASIHTSGSNSASLIGEFQAEQFLIWFESRSRMALICVKEGAQPQDLLKAWAVALQLAQRSHAGSDKAVDTRGHGDVLRQINAVWQDWMQELEGLGWDLSTSSVETGRATRLGIRKKE